MKAQRDDAIRKHLQTADEMLGAAHRQSAITPPTIRQLQQRGARQRLSRAAQGVAGAVAIVAIWLMFADTHRQHSQPREVALAMAGDVQTIQRESGALANAARFIRQEYELAGLRERLSHAQNEGAARIPDSRAPEERAAQLSLALASELDRLFGNTRDVIDEYQRIVDVFPETPSAMIAKSWLVAADVPTTTVFGD